MTTFGTNERSGARIRKILTNVGWPDSLRNIDTGLVTVTGSQEASGSALQQMQQVAAAELGVVFISKTGEVVFRERYSEVSNSASSTSAGTFSETPGSSLPYKSLSFNYSDDQLKNQVVVSRLTGTTQATMQDGESIGLYGVRSEDLNDLVVTTDADARQVGELYLTIYAKPEYFPEAMELVPEAKPATLYPQVLGRELRDRIVVTFTSTGGIARTVNCYVDGIEHQVTPGGWTTTFSLTNASIYDNFFILDSSTSGLLDTNVLGA